MNTYQCQATNTKSKKRCLRDSTHYRGGQNLCSQHNDRWLEEIKKDKYAAELHNQKETCNDDH